MRFGKSLFGFFIVGFLAVLGCGNQVCVMGHLGECDGVASNTAPPIPTPTASSLTIGRPVDSVVAGGKVFITAAGGVPPYTFTATLGQIEKDGRFTAPNPKTAATAATVIRVTDNTGASKETSLILN